MHNYASSKDGEDEQGALSQLSSTTISDQSDINLKRRSAAQVFCERDKALNFSLPCIHPSLTLIELGPEISHTESPWPEL